MNNLQTFDNIYANLAQSAYRKRPLTFSELDSILKVEEIDYSVDEMYENTTVFGGQNLPNNGIVYLQPDPTKKVLYKKVDSHVITGGKNHVETFDVYENEKGLLSDRVKGFNAYFLTDTPTLTNDTKETYLAIRGSDGFRFALHDVQLPLNDWLDNNEPFIMSDAYIPQAKLTHEAITVKVQELKTYAPSAQLNITGHSLGSINAAQAVANLDAHTLERINKVVLFHGPDVMKSLKKMGLSEEQIKRASEKVEYFLNPFDIVSMANRDVPENEQFGKTHIIVPLHYKGTFDDGVAHDFGDLQMDSKGNILVATPDFHPELIEAGEKISRLTRKYIDIVKSKGGTYLTAITEGLKALLEKQVEYQYNVEVKYLLDEFKKEYDAIIQETRQQSLEWNYANIPLLQERILKATGEQEIMLRQQLVLSAAQLATFENEDRINQVKTLLKQYKEQVYHLVHKVHQQVYGLGKHLNHYELENLISNFQLHTFWRDDIESEMISNMDKFQVDIEQFSQTLVKAAEQMVMLDKGQGQSFEEIMTTVQERWRK
ncbi:MULTISPECIES: DUF2974 domain-containing protein [unclassified Granulicatella]|uniref:lipase family protein n=1 Tax=unclassified Granulicatella TaxID=2630493 RepID=UPI00107375B0|nr:MULTISPECIES: DUF2974 domain-containing protein [unclassified Granulicatella]MBF0780235.1 DUF2974 domain-containing protein [Granulicatella sp. 19428wC4_WM01]TFU95669.1 DUF2974 domain-containing protein [Granulicatella sp. WM01]